jgi:oligogalacturonide transporter
MIARVFDAVIDPFIGSVSDKMRVRFKTRRGLMLVCAPFIVLSMFLMFYPYSNPNVMVRFWMVLLSYMFFYGVLSCIMIPYYSLSSEITEDYTERASMTTVRLSASILSSIVCVAVPGMIVGAYDGNTGYIVMSLIFGVIFMICVGITGLFAKEGIPPPPKAERFDLKNFIKPLRVKTFRQYLGLFLCCQITMAAMSALFFFYVDFYFCRDVTASGGGNMVGMIGAAVLFGTQIVALPVYMAMIRKTSKMTAYIFGAVIWIVSALVLLIVPANADVIWLYILAAVMGFGISGPGLIPHAIFADVVDVGQLQFSERSAGAFSGIANFINTVAQALGLAIVMNILGMAGFTEQEPGSPPILSQPVSAQNAIIMLMAFTPLICMSVGIYMCSRYRLNKENHTRVLAALEGTDEEKEAVLKLL